MPAFKEELCVTCGRPLGTRTSSKRKRTRFQCRFCKEGVRVGQGQ